MTPHRSGARNRVLVLILAATSCLLMGAPCNDLLELATAPKYKKLYEELREPDLLRDPRQSGAEPGSSEATCVSDFDIMRQNDFDTAPAITSFDSELADLAADAQILDTIAYQTSSDFRFTRLPFAGGAPGHETIFLDGKLLAILNEYSHYLALAELGLATVSVVDAVDLIVERHMLVDYDSSGLTPYFFVGGQPAILAQGKFRALAGALFYHEFGHYFLYQVLDHCRDHLADELPGVPPDLIAPSKENDADIVAGFLSGKAGYDRDVAQQMYDLMAFYAEWQPGQSFAQLPTYSGQFLEASSEYAPLVRRRRRFAAAHKRF